MPSRLSRMWMWQIDYLWQDFTPPSFSAMFLVNKFSIVIYLFKSVYCPEINAISLWHFCAMLLFLYIYVTILKRFGVTV